MTKKPVLVWVLLGLTVGCGGPQFTEVPADASPDGSATDGTFVEGAVLDDAAPDPAHDARAEADPEAGSDASPEAGGDAGPEAGSDAGPEAGGDAGPDADAGLGVESADGEADATADGPAADAADAEACGPTLYYLDGDGDGYGGTTTAQACDPPDGGRWITTGGDCDDSNPTVNPGQAAYFTVGYTPTGKSVVSFDYDCDGVETESGNPAKLDCQLSSLACVGGGYVVAAPARSGGGVDAYCGSNQAEGCSFVSLACTAGAPYKTSPVACH